MSKQIGYARVSTTHQATDRQVAALKDAGCEVVYNEVISTRTSEGDRPQLQACLASLNEGDELVITTLSRLGRTQHEVINRLHDLQKNGVHIRTLDGLINSKALGKMAPLVVGLLTGLNEVERELCRERTRESIAHRRRSVDNLGGRPTLPKVKTEFSKENERYLREMLSKNSLYGTMQDIVDMAIKNFYRVEKKRRFR